MTGCKIKALRAKTNTYIKTPVRGEQPVFVVTGRKEDVAMAKREIMSAAEHFSLIRASRNRTGPLTAGASLGTPALPGRTTIQVSKLDFKWKKKKEVIQGLRTTVRMTLCY